MPTSTRSQRVRLDDLLRGPRSAQTRPSGMDADSADRVAVLLKAVADPVRLRLFAQIAAHPSELCVCELTDVGVGQATVSHHLRRLREAALVDCERRGTWVYYWPTATGRDLAQAVARIGRATP